MTRDYSQETTGGGGSGGGKKFLYAGARKRSAFDDDDVDTQQWSYNHTSNGSSSNRERGSGGEFDVEGIWNVRNNIGVTGKQQNAPKPGVQDGWDRGSKGFYSRHGSIQNGAQENSAMTNGNATDPSGKTWPRAYNSYSYTSPSGGQPQQGSRGSGTGGLSKDFKPVTPSPRQQNGSLAIHNISSPITVSPGGGGQIGMHGSAKNSVQRRGMGARAPAEKHFDF